MTRSIAAWSLVLGLGLASAAAGEERTVASRDGVRIAYRAEGSGSPALVFVHCWSCDRGYWDAQVTHFAPRHRVLAVDLAGHGASADTRTDWAIPGLGEDVAAAVLQEKLDRVVLVGHSMGGPVALEAARILGPRVVAVVGVDTLHDLDGVHSAAEIEEFVRPFERDFAGRTEAFVRSMFPATADRALVDRIARDMAAAPPKVALACFRALFSYRAGPTLDEIRVPVFAINADKYPVNREAVTRHGLSFEVELMRGLGHFLAQEDPAQFNRLLEKVLAGLAAPVPPSPGPAQRRRTGPGR